jgi:hypothetical protein
VDNEKEFETLKDMFMTDGWKLFVSYLQTDADILANCRYIKDEKELYFARGKLAVLDDLINFESKLDAVQQNEASE